MMLEDVMQRVQQLREKNGLSEHFVGNESAAGCPSRIHDQTLRRLGS